MLILEKNFKKNGKIITNSYQIMVINCKIKGK